MKRRLILLVVATIAFCVGIARAQTETDKPFESESNEHVTGELVRQGLLLLQEESGLSPDAFLSDWHKRIASRHEGGLLPLSNGLTFEWKFLGPKNQSGRVNTIQLTPGNHLVIGTSGGGIWQLNTDSSWTPKTDTFPSLRISCSAESPYDSACLAMGTGEGFLYLSSDAGKSWNVAATSPGINISSIAFGLHDTKQIFVASDFGLKVTTNGGSSWTSVPNSWRARSVILNPKNNQILYYCRKGYNWPNSSLDVMKSTDGGVTFNSVFSGKHGFWSDALFGMCADHPEVLWVGLDSAHLYYRSTDAGESWVQCSAVPWTDSYTNGFWMFTADPHDPNVAFAGGPGLFRTTDGGASWSRCDKGVHADFHNVTFGSGSTAAVACDGGVYTTEDYLAYNLIWKYVSNGLVTLEAYNVAGSPDGENISIAGNQDNGYAKFSGDPTNWQIVGGDGFRAIYDKEDPKIFYHEYTNSNLHRANDGFSWWGTKIMDGLPTTSDFYTGIVNRPVDWYGQSLAMDPSNSSILYCGTDSLYRTIDKGDNWAVVGSSKLSNGAALTAVSISPKDPETIYTGSADGVVSLTTDNGYSWYRVDKAQFLNQLPRVSRVLCSQSDALTAYVILQSTASSKGVFRTTNGGVKWLPITTGLPYVTPTSIIEYPDRPDTLILGTTVGLFYSVDRGGHWTEFSNFPNVFVQDLAWQKVGSSDDYSLLVATFGRGVVRGQAGVSFAAVDSVVFPPTRAGQFVDSTLVLFRNSTPEPVTLENVESSDPVTFPIMIDLTTFTIAAGASQAIPIRFQPQTAGDHHAIVSCYSEQTGLQQISLTGTARALSLGTPKTVDFGRALVGDVTDSAMHVGLTGTVYSSDTVHVQYAQVLGDDFDDFSVATPADLVTALGSLLRVTFNPKSPGQKSAVLQITSDATNSYDTVILKGFAQTPASVEQEAINRVSLEPNPVSTRLHITHLPARTSQILLRNEAGQTVKKVAVGTDQTEASVDTRNLSNGVYYVRFVSSINEHISAKENPGTSDERSSETKIVILH